ncbi:MAG: glycosyltransferase family 4 protein [Actinobacteria bacterium]|nr:glycosyltransferase family 4 protein [Actinomycetota bacterium]
MKRLLITTTDFPPTRGGIQTMTREIARRIKRFDVRVVAPAADGSDAVDNELAFPVRRAAWLPGGQIGAFSAVNIAAWREARAWKPDVTLAMHVLAAPAPLARNVPTIIATHAAELRSPRIRKIARRVFPRAAGILAVSGYSAKESIALGAPADRVALIPNGAPEPKDVSKEAVAALRGRYGLGDDPVVLTIARLMHHKGIDSVIESLTALPDNTRYLVVGDGPYRADLAALAAQKGVSDRVAFAGNVADDVIPTCYAAADVFALMSREIAGGAGGTEGCPVALLEASAYGLPIVTSRIGGIADAISDDRTGLLIDPDNPAEVIRGLSSVLTRPELASRLGNEAKRVATSERSWATVVEKIEALLEGIAREAAA